jgi:outer membrane lipopolysaccharide assembly protein LptE/RlpB
MRSTLMFSAAVAAVLALSACGEKPQDKMGVRSDQPAQAGTGVAAFTEPGWKAGDQASWSNHLKARAHYGMNDHQRAPK